MSLRNLLKYTNIIDFQAIFNKIGVELPFKGSAYPKVQNEKDIVVERGHWGIFEYRVNHGVNRKRVRSADHL